MIVRNKLPQHTERLAIEIIHLRFYIWKNHHHKDSEFEVIARNWNGGPKGYKSNKTEKYWNKVEQQLNQTNG